MHALHAHVLSHPLDDPQQPCGFSHMLAISVYCCPAFQQLLSDGGHEVYLMGAEQGSKKAAIGIVRSWIEAGERCDNTKV